MSAVYAAARTRATTCLVALELVERAGSDCHDQQRDPLRGRESLAQEDERSDGGEDQPELAQNLDRAWRESGVD